MTPSRKSVEPWLHEAGIKKSIEYSKITTTMRKKLFPSNQDILAFQQSNSKPIYICVCVTNGRKNSLTCKKHEMRTDTRRKKIKSNNSTE